ncbi:hypothetical protein ACNOYE_29000 [Nannocystaceae bacterium ST9]
MSETSTSLARTRAAELAMLGWPHVVVPRRSDRRVARAIVKTFGLVLGASTGMFVGGMLGIVVAMLMLPFFGEVAIGVLIVVTLAATSTGAVVGSRVLERETFDE